MNTRLKKRREGKEQANCERAGLGLPRDFATRVFFRPCAVQSIHSIAIKAISIREGIKRQLYVMTERVHKDLLDLSRIEVVAGA